MNHSPDAARAADPLTALRAATASRHAALDSGLPIGAPDASLDDYTAHLALLRAWLAPLQAWLAGFADGPACDHAARLCLIETDLAEAGAALHGDVFTLTDAWPAAASPAYRWGVHYVIEGSQLGGAVLYERLRERLAPHRLRYLQGDAAGPGPRWRTFMQALRAGVRPPAAIPDAGARAGAAGDPIRERRGVVLCVSAPA